MGVRNVNGQDLAALAERFVAKTPAPPVRSAEAAKVEAPKIWRAFPALNEEQVQRAASSGEGVAKLFTSRPRLRVDEISNRVVAQIVNENNEVIKQIPPEEMLKISARMRRFVGLFFDERI
jgi:uncharacterized FlaG/YvyC family protein